MEVVFSLLCVGSREDDWRISADGEGFEVLLKSALSCDALALALCARLDERLSISMC